MERPWKDPSRATMRVRPVRRESLIAASVASVPELAKKTPEPLGAAAIDSSRSARAIAGSDVKKLRDVDRRLGLLGDRLDERGVAVAERVHGYAGQQVEVALAVDVGDPAAVTRGEDQLRGAEDLDHRAGIASEQLVAHRHGVSSGVGVGATVGAAVGLGAESARGR